MKEFTDLGRQVALLRKQKNMTQQTLANLAGIAQPTLARFETGGVSEFGSRKLLRLLEILGYEIEFVPGKQGFTLDDALKARQAGQ
jgi:transcriptional regulator with XRE-family HTH domain